ncbi:MAG TPA: gamma-glutamyl-gamma-aminobutyrate hydrolase family protein [Candidatus Acidoferrales bacterium]|nr:gamma-glutamyl-gamma-aminobutyrate hydrolase family protein [Candidatus Acidoferrales bacterium]
MSSEVSHKPRIGVPWRMAKEEAENDRYRYDDYLRAVREAGGQAVEISLELARPELEKLLETLDAVVLPGSPADVDPARYGARRQDKCADSDPQRERTDCTLLDHAFAARKPVLAICYGTQLLNVYLHGKLIQDVPSELRTSIRHNKAGLPAGAADPRHGARVEPGSKIAALAESAGMGPNVEVNSSHHQAVLEPGRGLRITASAPDGVVEAVEWTGSDNWVVGVQWHPERMPGDALAAALFRELVAAARTAAVRG